MELLIIMITIGSGSRSDCRTKSTGTPIRSEESPQYTSHSEWYIPLTKAIVGTIGVLLVIFSIAFILFQERYYDQEKTTIIQISEISEVILVSTLSLLSIVSIVAVFRRKNITCVGYDGRKKIELVALGIAWLILETYSILTIYGAMKYEATNQAEIVTRRLTIAAALISMFQSLLQFALIWRATPRIRYFSENMLAVWIIGSFAMWLFDSFSAKKFSTNTIQLETYGHQNWTLLGAFFIPLSIFFRFHSCIVLAHMKR